MKEEELMMKHDSHKAIYRSENKHEKQQTINNKVDNRVRQSRLCLWAFVSVGEVFLISVQSFKITS
jgi:hypothetical protein